MRPLRTLLLGSCLLAIPAFAMGPILPVPPAAERSADSRVPPIPEPAAFALFVLGAGVVGVAIRRRKG